MFKNLNIWLLLNRNMYLSLHRQWDLHWMIRWKIIENKLKVETYVSHIISIPFSNLIKIISTYWHNISIRKLLDVFCYIHSDFFSHFVSLLLHLSLSTRSKWFVDRIESIVETIEQYDDWERISFPKNKNFHNPNFLVLISNSILV